MKPFYIITALVLLLAGSSEGATITAVSSGSWGTNSVWSCNCQPSSSDNIVIPAGFTITASGPIILFLGPVINITIGGTLVLNNASLQIDGSDVVNILSGGKITGTGLLGGSVYSGVMPIFVASGSTVSGPQTITNGTLPIKLVYFESSTTGDGIFLKWASSEERELDYYDIERSNDGKSFSSISTIDSKDENGAEYTFIDTAPFPATSYYRLGAVYVDGSREEMKVIKSEWNAGGDWVTIYPNPVADGTIHVRFSESGDGALQLLDCTGLVVTESLLVNTFSGSLELPVAVPPGAYFVSARQNGHTVRIKVIISSAR